MQLANNHWGANSTVKANSTVALDEQPPKGSNILSNNKQDADFGINVSLENLDRRFHEFWLLKSLQEQAD